MEINTRSQGGIAERSHIEEHIHAVDLNAQFKAGAPEHTGQNSW
jgi:hypothetical protein